MRRTLQLLLILLTTAPLWAQDWARQRLDSSPRHLEWVELDSAGRKLRCFVAYPEVKGKARTVVLIHEIFGLTDWVRGVADQLAERGYVVLAPDLLSGSAPGGGGTAELGGDDAARQAISKLPPDQIRADLDSVASYAAGLPASNGELVVAGFCWGGSQSFRYATHNPRLLKALVFYGTAPEPEAELSRIQAPVYGFYAENDARVNQTLERTEAAMKSLGKTFEATVYAGAGHGFMRAGEAPGAGEANRRARQEAWKRIESLLK